MIDFFEYYKNRGNNDNNNDSIIFHYENDTEKLNKDKDNNVEYH